MNRKPISPGSSQRFGSYIAIEEHNTPPQRQATELAVRTHGSYVIRMSRKLSTTVRLDPEDAEALARARADGLSSSELIRRGLRVVAARYYRNRRAPSTGLFVSISP